MVKVEIVEEKDQQAVSSPYSSPASSRTSSSISLSSVDSDSPIDESLLDRIAALKDIVPPATRHSLTSKVSKTASFFKRSTKFAGNVIWVVTTSALLIGLPLALILEDEAKVVAQENEMLAQQQGAQQVRHSLLPLAPASLTTLLLDGRWQQFLVPSFTQRSQAGWPAGSCTTRLLNV
jgi:import receptor subunit TOM22